MTDEVLQKATEPFFTTKAVGIGTGLGLSMALGFAQQSKGHLEISSTLGEGTKVEMYLPVAKTIMPALKSYRELPDMTVAKTEATIQHRSALLIEDNIDFHNTILQQLEALGFTVHSAFDGPSAFEVAKKVMPVVLVISDILLPNGPNGRVVVTELYKKYPGFNTIFMTGFGGKVTKEGELMPDTPCLYKPFGRSELVAVITKELKNRDDTPSKQSAV